MSDSAHRATEQIHNAVDHMAEALNVARSDRDEGQRLAYDAALAGIDAYLVHPTAVARTLIAIDGERAAAAKVLIDTVDRVHYMAVHRLAKEVETHDVKVSFSGIASATTVNVGETAVAD
jgi:hypothetical protein